MTLAGHEQIRQGLAVACAARGFDLLQPLAVGWYNERVDGTLRLADFGAPEHLAVVIGNTRALWPKFVAAVAGDAALARDPHPLQRYTELCISESVASLGVPASIRFAHEAGERLVAMQRLAHVSGLAYLSESYLSVHPEYGPWIGLRAVVSFGVPGPAGPPPALSHPCGACDAGCLPAFRRALEATREQLDARGVAARWKLWVACRDACPVGRQHRYSEAQLRYHYLKERRQLGVVPGTA